MSRIERDSLGTPPVPVGAPAGLGAKGRLTGGLLLGKMNPDRHARTQLWRCPVEVDGDRVVVVAFLGLLASGARRSGPDR